jgi:hypothetical protein
MKDFIYQHALENLDVYPASYNGIPRTEYQNGWNACVFKMHENVRILTDWYKALALHQGYQMLVQKYGEDIQISISEAGTVSLYVNISDVFIPASDMEEITIKDLKNLEQLYDDFGFDALIAHCAYKNNYKTQKFSQPFSSNVKKALKIIKQREEKNEVVQKLISKMGTL